MLTHPPVPARAAEMDGIEASRRLHEALPPDEAPIVVALSADTLQVSLSLHKLPHLPLMTRVCLTGHAACPACRMPQPTAARGQHPAELRSSREPAASPLPRPAAQMQDTKCAAAGFSAFICKPFRVEDVQRVLRLVQQ